jgi:hypothetical protein
MPEGERRKQQKCWKEEFSTGCDLQIQQRHIGEEPQTGLKVPDERGVGRV